MPRVKYEWVDASKWGVAYMTKWPLFSYGSNLDPAQLLRRAPGAVFQGAAHANFARLRFYGNSAMRGGVATLRPSKSHEAWAPGILTSVTADDVRSLDTVEGLRNGVYGRFLITVVDDNRQPIRCFTYLRLSETEAGPTQDYVDRIAKGYRFFGLDLEVLRAAVARQPIYTPPPEDNDPAPEDDDPAPLGALAIRTPRQSAPRSPRPPGGRLGGAAMVPAVPSMTDRPAVADPKTAAALAAAKLASEQASQQAAEAAEDDHPGNPDYRSVYRAPPGRPVSRPYATAMTRGGEVMPGWWHDANGRDPDNDDGPDAV